MVVTGGWGMLRVRVGFYFNFGRTRSLSVPGFISSRGEQRLLSSCGTPASRFGGLSCGAQA